MQSVILSHKVTTFSYLNHSRKIWACTGSVLEPSRWFVHLRMRLREWSLS